MSILNLYRQGDRDNPAMLLLHGFMGSGKDWQPVIPFLKPDFYLIAPDLPGHGESRYLYENGDYDFITAADFVLDILDDLHIRQSILVGYSMGGRLALYLAFQNPERFSHLIVESASPGITDESERVQRREKDATTAEYLIDRDLNAFMESWYDQPLFGGLRGHPRYSELLADRVRNDPEELARALRGMGQGQQPPLWEQLAGISLRALFLAGDQDEKYSAMLDKVAAVNPGVNTEIIPGAGHNIHFMQPERYAKTIVDFINNGR